MTRTLAIALTLLVATGCQSGNLSVPIGDPEKSRINGDLSGIWYVDVPNDESTAEADEENADGNWLMVFMVAPFDRRTWLVTQFRFESGERLPERPELFGAWIRSESTKAGACTPMKTWLARLGGIQFVVAEPQYQRFDGNSFVADKWLVSRLEIQNKDAFTLTEIDGSFMATPEGPALREIKHQRIAEAIIRKHARSASLYDASPGKHGPRILKFLRLPFSALDGLQSRPDATAYSRCTR